MFIDIFSLQNQEKYIHFLAIFLIARKRFDLLVNERRKKKKTLHKK
jgi:hypothetical protein